MTHEDREGELLERALAEWAVPEPPADLTDRILAHNADALVPRAHPEPAPLREETPTMLPTEHRSSSSLRPFWTATLVGFAAAAALLLAFTAGRESVPEAPLSPSIPNVEIQVTAPAPAPPAPPTPPAEVPLPERVIIEETAAPAAPAEPPKPRRPARAKEHEEAERPYRAVSPDLKNPFGGGEGQLRIGTLPGVAPAQVYVDGEHIGPTPLANVRVDAGEHTVRFEWDDGTVQEQRVEVNAGDLRTVRGSTSR